MFAIPDSASRPPIQLTALPVNANTSCAPAVFDRIARPPLDSPAVIGSQAQGPACTAGSVSSTRTAFLTVTATGDERARLPERSRATAVSTWAPSATVVVSQRMEYAGAVSGGPRPAPSISN